MDKCIRCGYEGHAIWRICADGNKPRAICKWCDVFLNAMVMEWAFGVNKKTAKKILDYSRKVHRYDN